jgi:hypothetical protein
MNSFLIKLFKLKNKDNDRSNTKPLFASKRRCSFKLSAQQKQQDAAESVESGLLETSTDRAAVVTAAAAAASAAPTTATASSQQQPHTPPNRVKKAMGKSLSVTSSISNLSLSQSQSRVYFNKLLIKCNYFVFGPDDNTMFLWLIVLNVCVLYNIWLIIARQSFEKLQTGYYMYWRVADAVADSIYLIDVAIQFRTGYLEQGEFM